MTPLNWIAMGLMALLAAFVVLLTGPSEAPVVPEPPPVAAPQVPNDPPVITGRPGWPFMAMTMAGWNDLVVFDANNRGDCATPCDEICFDISDPDDDELLYKWEFYGPNEQGAYVSYTVFNVEEEPIIGWTSDRIVAIVVGWTGGERPRVLVIKGCDPPIVPYVPPVATQEELMMCKLSVWDGVNDPVFTRWRQPVGTATCEGG